MLCSFDMALDATELYHIIRWKVQMKDAWHCHAQKYDANKWDVLFGAWDISKWWHPKIDFSFPKMNTSPRKDI